MTEGNRLGELAARCEALAKALEADAIATLLSKEFKTVTRQGYEYFSDEEKVRPARIAAALDNFDLAERLRSRARGEGSLHG
jgi:hypothetical protein